MKFNEQITDALNEMKGKALEVMSDATTETLASAIINAQSEAARWHKEYLGVQQNRDEWEERAHKAEKELEAYKNRSKVQDDRSDKQDKQLKALGYLAEIVQAIKAQAHQEQRSESNELGPEELRTLIRDMSQKERNDRLRIKVLEQKLYDACEWQAAHDEKMLTAQELAAKADELYSEYMGDLYNNYQTESHEAYNNYQTESHEA